MPEKIQKCLAEIGSYQMVKRILLFALVLVSLIIGTAGDDRFFVEVFPYASVGNARPDDVTKLLKDKLRRLAEQTISAHPELDRLNKINVFDKKDPLPASGEALAKYWAGSPTTLEILSGVISSNPDVLTSNIYLGELQGSLKTRTVSVQIPLTPVELKSCRDMHGALMLYALAMDAKGNNQQRSIVLQYLAEAESLLKDIRQRATSPTDVGAESLSDAVAKEVSLLKK